MPFVHQNVPKLVGAVRSRFLVLPMAVVRHVVVLADNAVCIPAVV